MKAIRIFFRSIRDAFKSIGRNFSLSMASIICVTITLIIVSVSVVIATNIKNATSLIEDEMNIVVYLDAKATTNDADNLKSEIKALGGIKEITYTSKDEAKQNMMDYDDTFKVILDYLEDNPLLDSFVIHVDDVRELSNIAEGIKTLPNVQNVKYGEGMVEEIVSAFTIVRNIAFGIVIALVAVSIFLITNTIRLTIFSRKNEVSIMRLVGASNTAIKLPFLIEGFVLGIIGSIIPICITVYGYVILFNSLNGYMFTEMLKFIQPYPYVFYISGFITLIGGIVGMFGSSMAVGKYLKI